VGVVLQNGLLEVQEGALVVNTLAHLHQRLPAALAKLRLTLRALHVPNHENDQEGLLENDTLFDLLLDSELRKLRRLMK
tara:strand:- start:147 stop:383 length:237 start_codon:yes stop_codon:yes gene_type:complete